MKRGSAFVVLLLVAALAATGYFLYQNKDRLMSPASNSEVSVDLTSGENMDKEGEEMMDADKMSEKDSMTMDSLADSENSLSGELVDVSGGTSRGTAFVLREGKLLHIVTATLPDPAEGSAYEGWLVNKTPSLKFFSTGLMQKQADGSYTLEFMSQNTYEGYNFVVITEETVVDETPEVHIIEGTVI